MAQEPFDFAQGRPFDSAQGKPFIICDNLVKIYQIADLESVALQGLDLVVAAGELMGIVGPSGSGKTTLMNILGGIDRPSAGRVWVGGQDLLKMSDAALNRYRRSKVGFVWQQGSRNLIPYLNALENVELPITLAGQDGRKKRQRAEGLLEAMGLADRRHHYMTQLSGGEQQRVAIAVALANNPILLLADEPTGEVDSATALTIYEAFQRLNREYGLTTLIVSHDPNIARHMGRVVAIRDGKTATETVRQSTLVSAPEDESASESTAQAEEEVFEELAVLDSAGRLQVPKEYLEHFSIKGRARLEVVEDGILIRPAPQSVHAQMAETSAANMVPVPETRRWRGLKVLSAALQTTRNRLSRRRRGAGEDGREL
jgi:ABC-type lipoprotein export system ATPase subunit/bifunctional DNA-binding transcriptional regulator/antitoxin component of YhaV-PrlF toxin-antitoxin module